MRKPSLGFWQIWNMSFGFFGIQIGFALQGANVSRIFETLGASVDSLAVLWLAGPVTGLLVQPLVGYFSDRTWGKLGRRRPYFLVGAILTTCALFVMPNSLALWVAAIMLWVMDASINISMEPFRAFVGDMLPSRQRTRGFAMQTIFIGVGAFLASIAPMLLTQLGVSATAQQGMIPDAVKYSFYIGAVALFLSVGWTVITTREYSPAEQKEFAEGRAHDPDAIAVVTNPHKPAGFYFLPGMVFLLAGLVASIAVWKLHAHATLYVLTGGFIIMGAFFLMQFLLARAGKTGSFFSQIMGDLTAMPKVMQRLAVVQFFSWCALFIMWVYGTAAVTSYHYGATDPTSAAYNEGANWLGALFGIYNAIAAVWAFVLPVLCRFMHRRLLHAINLLIGGVALASFWLIKDPVLLFIPMIGIGMAWASILTMPYAILSDALPQEKMGIYMGIFNFFIVIPQITIAGLMGEVLRTFLHDQAILTFLVAGASMAIAALTLLFVPGQAQLQHGADH